MLHASLAVGARHNGRVHKVIDDVWNRLPNGFARIGSLSWTQSFDLLLDPSKLVLSLPLGSLPPLHW